MKVSNNGNNHPKDDIDINLFNTTDTVQGCVQWRAANTRTIDDKGGDICY